MRFFLKVAMLLAMLHLSCADGGNIQVFMTSWNTASGGLLLLDGSLPSADHVPLSQLHPPVFGVVLLNTGEEQLELPVYIKQFINEKCLSFEIRDGNDILYVRNTLGDKISSEMLRKESMLYYCSIAIEPGQTTTIIPNFKNEGWINADEILRKKNKKNVQIRALYTYYPIDSNEGNKPIVYKSPWVKLSNVMSRF